MSRHPSRDAALALVDELAEHPDEAARRFVALGRWQRKKRGAMDAERLGRELGKSYREQVARIIGQHLCAEMYADESMRDRMHRSVRVGESLTIPEASILRSRAARALTASASRSCLEEERSCLEGIVGGTTRASRLERSLLAWRIHPLGVVASIAAFEYMFRREWDAAAHMLDPLLRNPLDSLLRSYAHEAMGALLMGRSDLKGCSEAYRVASSCGEDRPVPLGMWFAVALCVGDSKGALDAGKKLEEMLGPSSPEAAFCAGAIRYQRQRMGVPMVLGRGNFQATMAFGPQTRRIIDALL